MANLIWCVYSFGASLVALVAGVSLVSLLKRELARVARNFSTEAGFLGLGR